MAGVVHDGRMIRPAPALAALLLVAGCTEAGQEKAAAPAGAPPAAASAAAPVVCTPGQVRFGKIKRADVLTDVTPVMVITDPKGGPLDEPLEPVRTVTATVSAAFEVPPGVVYQRLNEERFENHTLADYGTVHEPEDNATYFTHGPGEAVRYEYVDRITASFTYVCGGAEYPGTVTTWLNGHSTGLIGCDDPRPRDDAVSREARKLRC